MIPIDSDLYYLFPKFHDASNKAAPSAICCALSNKQYLI